jgi:hypothetical protein
LVWISASKKSGIDRVDWIRTSDLCVPNEALYQIELRPDERNRSSAIFRNGCGGQVQFLLPRHRFSFAMDIVP